MRVLGRSVLSTLTLIHPPANSNFSLPPPSWYNLSHLSLSLSLSLVLPILFTERHKFLQPSQKLLAFCDSVFCRAAASESSASNSDVAAIYAPITLALFTTNPALTIHASLCKLQMPAAMPIYFNTYADKIIEDHCFNSTVGGRLFPRHILHSTIYTTKVSSFSGRRGGKKKSCDAV